MTYMAFSGGGGGDLAFSPVLRKKYSKHPVSDNMYSDNMYSDNMYSDNMYKSFTFRKKSKET